MPALPRLDVRRHRHRAATTRLLVAHETALELRLARALQDAGTQIARQQRDHGRDGRETALAELPHRLMQVLRPGLIATTRAFAAAIEQQAKGYGLMQTKAFDTLDAALADWVRGHAATRVQQIAGSTRAAIQEVLRRAVEEGWSEFEIAAAIEEATGGEVAGARARRIARTEAHTAANAGQFIAAQTSPLDYTKEWLATEDGRTREDHALANGQRVPMLASFILGGSNQTQGGRFWPSGDAWVPRPTPSGTAYNDNVSPPMVAMLYPGDPAAPPGQTINCRCTCLYAPVVDRYDPVEADPLPPLTEEEILDLALPPRGPMRRWPED